jgi:hypothetical protein
MASLTTEQMNIDNKAQLDASAALVIEELEKTSGDIAKLAEFEIDTQFDFKPIEISPLLLFGLDVHAKQNPNYYDKFPATISYGDFAPSGKLVSTDIPEELTEALEEAPIDTDVPAFPTNINLPEALELEQNYSVPVAPVVEDVLVPDAPPLDTVPVPVLNNVEIPDFYEPNIPLYESELPVIPDDFASPANEFEFDGGAIAFTSPEIEALETMLLDDLENGGYGIYHEDEENIFNREIDRETSLALSAEHELIDSYASRGFLIPNGVLMQQMKKLQQETQSKITGINRDTAIQRADLVRATRLSTQENVISLSQVLSTYQGFAYERLLKAEQFAASYALESFQAAVDVYNLRIGLYDSNVRSFVAQVQAEVAKLEVNKVQLEAAQLAQSLNESTIALYNAQLNGLQISVNIFNSQLAGTKIRAEIQNDKLQKYRIEFDIYQAEIQVDITRIALQKAQIDNESARVDFYKAELAAYLAKLDASKTQESIYLARFDAELKRKAVELEVYSKKEELYQTQLKQELDDINARMNVYSNDNTFYADRTQAYQAYISATIEQEGYNSREKETDLNWLFKNEEIRQQALLNQINANNEVLKQRVDSVSAIADALGASISHSDIVVSE